jgi:membrane fusion protein, multidrug efflux system
MLLVGRVAERDVARVSRAERAEATLLDGTVVAGRVSFVGSRNDTATRTYPVEIEVANPEYLIRSGITSSIRIPVDTVNAHRVSAALLTLDDAGNIGLRTVNGSQRVDFHRVEILGDEDGDVWITGLPEVATVITVGHELVVPGERVDVQLEASRDDGAGSHAARDRGARATQ